ncbi:hypothetical protein Trihar35433_2999 [Trichoderma harzianum]|nr:hypothetical protein Trihar35433_2999 [Trichoderma harzianum]
MSTASTTSWSYLPAEIRALVLEFLIKDGCSLAGFATVSREWQTIIEKHTFARITLTPFRLADFGPMIHRNQALVRYIWLCLELEEYDCNECDPDNEILGISFADNLRVITTFTRLFRTLSTWEPSGSLVLDISVHSPSDPLHWFRYLTFEPDAASGVRRPRRSSELFPLPRLNSHGWIGGRRASAPNVFSFQKVFAEILGEKGPFDNDQQEEQWWQKLPVVPAVTAVLLRQQTRRRWKPKTLKYMFAHFPRLEDLHYEPWMQWYDVRQELTDRDLISLSESLTFRQLRNLVLFENFNPQYLLDFEGCDPYRISTREVSRAIAEASLKLEHLSASIMVDASYFFQAREPSWTWPNLAWLAMTSRLLGPGACPAGIDAILIAAAAAAMKMPNLQVMELWNGQKGMAILFRYQKAEGGEPAVITRKATWEFALAPAVIGAWEDVAREHRCTGCVVIKELIDVDLIQSLGDAIHHLKLSNPVIRPISLRQIRIEHGIQTGEHTLTEGLASFASE